MGLFGLGKKKKTESALPSDDYKMGEAAMEAYNSGDCKKALELFEKQAEYYGNVPAMYNCGVLYSHGKGTTTDKAKALYWYEKAAEQGHAGAQDNCGVLYENGEGTTADKAKALYWFEKSAEQGSASAQYHYAMCYYFGEGTEVDQKKALYWYEKAAEQGDADAQYNCGLMHEKGEGTEKNQKKALYWYEKAAEQGHAKAQNNCGVMYDSGKGTTMDKAKALYWYEKAAEQGHANAQYNLGLLYTQGKETENSREKALYWFKKAAEQGHEQAKSRLEFSEDEELLAEAQRAYDNKEFKRSFQIILPLAEKGIMKAQLMVSGQYYFGEGVEKDLEKAVFWLEKAKENGSEDAKKILPQFQMKLFGQLNEEGGQAMRAGDFDKHKELMKKAMHYAIQAAKQGLPIAVYTCAVTELVLDGNKESTEMDRFKAKQSLQEVAAQTEDLKAQELAKQALREYF